MASNTVGHAISNTAVDCNTYCDSVIYDEANLNGNSNRNADANADTNRDTTTTDYDADRNTHRDANTGDHRLASSLF
jgi:hypothetical protein